MAFSNDKKQHSRQVVTSMPGMTLIELLISLAIIAIMTGIAFPMFSYYQKRSVVDEDISNFVSLFNYARALQNNPDGFSRSNSTESYSYKIKLIESNGTYRAELFSSADQSTIIDSVDFSQPIIINDEYGRSNGLVLSLDGVPPKEVLSCQPENCDSSIRIGFSTANRSVTKTATIINSSSDQLLSISVK